MTYELIDSGNKQRLERFGKYILIRPASQALWKPQEPKLWNEAHAVFKRDLPWKGVPQSWNISYRSVNLKLVPTNFGHLGIFPEHMQQWDWIESKLKPKSNILNLFGYTGATSLYLAKKGHSVCHVDAAKGIVEWAKQNAHLNNLQSAPIRWIVDDALKFLSREIKRKNVYDAVLLDPPSFGRGAQGQVFKIERDLSFLLDLCKKVLKPIPDCILLTCHTPGISPLVLKNIVQQIFPKLFIDSGEMVVESEGLPLPLGIYAKCAK